MFKGTHLLTGFVLDSPKPLDARTMVTSMEDLLNISESIKYAGMQVYVVNEDLRFKLNSSNEWVVENFTFLNGEADPTNDIGEIGDVYLNTVSGALFKKAIIDEVNLISAWENIGSFKGPKGDTGTNGIDGNIWYFGTTITGIDGTGLVFPSSGISNAKLNDFYYNNAVNNIYVCSLAGDANTAKWRYLQTIKGQKGDPGTPGEQGIPGDKGDPGLLTYRSRVSIPVESWIETPSGSYTSQFNLDSISQTLTENSDIYITPVISDLNNINAIFESVILPYEMSEETNSITFASETLPTIPILYDIRILEYAEPA